MSKKIKLLAPAGDFPSLNAAVENGADEVYFGLEGFNMRDSARNFKLGDLKKINQICGRKVKKYLTMNTIIYDDEIKKVDRILRSVKGKVDAVICWDLSIISLCNKYGIPIHISTQASVSNKQSALFYKKLGVERIVLARELNLKQIRDIAKIIDVEVFAHGAMCVAISGRCFTSQFYSDKSANRGECLQSCRRSYRVIDEDGNELKLENNRVMSAKDLCTLPFIEEIKKIGVRAIKIEGRNRPAEYVMKVVKVYRNAIDNKLKKQEINDSLRELENVYNRGFSSGFYLGVPKDEDFANDSKFGAARESKHFIGKIVKYWPIAGVGAIIIKGRSIKIGDKLYIKGKYNLSECIVSSIQINHKNVMKALKGQEVGIKIPKCQKGDEVYLVLKNNLN
jgi:U32 family peptidase